MKVLLKKRIARELSKMPEEANVNKIPKRLNSAKL